MSRIEEIRRDVDLVEVARRWGVDIRQRGDEHVGLCPFHEENTPSFAIYGRDGAQRFHCFGCGEGGDVIDFVKKAQGLATRAALAQLDRNFKEPTTPTAVRIRTPKHSGASEPKRETKRGRRLAQWDYLGADGRVVFRVLKFELLYTDDNTRVVDEAGHPKKEFAQRRPDGHGGWIPDMQGVERVLYRLPSILAASEVWIAEGERDADSLVKLGLEATTIPGGAKARWYASFTEALRDKHVVICPDTDVPGKQHGTRVAGHLRCVAASLRVCRLPDVVRDVTEFLDAGQSRDDLEGLVETIEHQSAGEPLTTQQAKERRSQAARSKNERRRILVTNEPLPSMTASALLSLQEANRPPRLFVRSGRMVSITKLETGRHFITGVTEASLRGHLARTATYIKVNSKQQECTTHPPMEVVKDILEHVAPTAWGFPAITAVTEAPVLRPDGSIVAEPGYDAYTRIYYAPAPGLLVPEIPELPNRDDIDGALEFIEEMLGEFPFVKPADRANAIASLLTPIIKPAINSPTPLALYNAPTPGTGKSLLADLVSILAQGRPGDMTDTPKSPEEWKKTITTVLSSGSGVVIFDNVERGKLDSSALCIALTQSFWSDRILGVQKQITLPVNCCWIATGNNISLGGDLPRRCYWINLDAQVAQPETRTGFRHADLIGWATQNRGRLLAALLILVRAWYVAGRPKAEVRSMGSFQRWVDTVGGVLAHAGVSGFLANADEMFRVANPEATQWEGFLLSLHEVFGERRFTLAEVVKRLTAVRDRKDGTQEYREGETIKQAMPDFLMEATGKTDGKFQRVAGRLFSDKVNRPYGKSRVCLVRGVDEAGTDIKVHGAQTWQVLIKGEIGDSLEATNSPQHYPS